MKKSVFLPAFLVVGAIVSGWLNDARSQEHGFVGMQVQGANELMAEALGMDDPDGALVRDIAVGSPGDKAGFLRGDLILKVNEAPVRKFEDLIAAMLETRPGDRRQFSVLRRGETEQLTVRFTNWPPARQIQKAARGRYPAEGLSLDALTDEIREEFGIRWGVVGVAVTGADQGGLAAEAGIEEGDVIVMANGEDVWRPEQIDAAFKSARRRGVEQMLMLVESRAGFRYVLMPGGAIAEDEAYADGPGLIGLKMQTIDTAMARALNLGEPGGSVVTDIILGSGAARAGFRRGDIITTVNGRSVSSVTDVFDVISAEQANSRVETRILRGDYRKTLKPRTEPADQAWFWQEPADGRFMSVGLTLASLSGEVRRRYGLRWGMTGLAITDINADTPTADAGLQPGDVILQINQQPVTTPAEFEAALKAAIGAGRKHVLLLVETVSGYSPRVLPISDKET
ncbi:MAG: PDZ domain-containing protein [Rhodospirillales bacterium]